MTDDDDLAGLTARLHRLAERESECPDSNAVFFEQLVKGYMLAVSASQHRIVEAIALIDSGRVREARALLNLQVQVVDEHLAELGRPEK